MKNIEFVSNQRKNIQEFKKEHNATSFKIIKSEGTYADGTSKCFYALNDSTETVVNGKTVYGTRGPVSEKIARAIKANNPPKMSEVSLAPTREVGKADIVWMLVSNADNSLVSWDD